MKDFFRRNKYGTSQFFAPEGGPGGDPRAGGGKTDPPAKPDAHLFFGDGSVTG